MWAVSRIAGTGFLLPTAAAATLVLTATGVHLGTNTVDLGSNSGAAAPAPAPAPAPAQPILADRREPQELKSNALRASRASSRTVPPATASARGSTLWRRRTPGEQPRSSPGR